MSKTTPPKEIDFDKITTYDDFFSMTQTMLGSEDKKISNTLYGLNHHTQKPVTLENRDSYGLTFITRPQLNLTTTNLRNIRFMYSLLTTEEKSVHRYIRCMLDPRLHYDGITSPLVDPHMAFIPILTNTVKTVSGWPDIVLPTFTSKEGLRKEQWSIGDGSIDIFNTFDLDLTFKNIKDEPITLLMQTWVAYISLVFEGMMSPYMDFGFTENEIDYETRIYRLVLDESKKYVKKIAATGVGFPVNVPTGKFFDFSDATKYNDQTKDINIRFKCTGAFYNDYRLVEEFNQTQAIFNPDIRKMLNNEPHNLDKIPYSLRGSFNYRAYPIINRDTLELEWWADRTSPTYKKIFNTLKG